MILQVNVLGKPDYVDIVKKLLRCEYTQKWQEVVHFVIIGRAASIEFNRRCKQLKIKPKKYVIKQEKLLTSMHYYDKLSLRKEILAHFAQELA